MKADQRSKQEIIKESLELMRAAIEMMKTAMPRTDPELIGGFFANLFDVWETGQELDMKLRELVTLQLPRDAKRVGDILTWVEAIQLDMGSFWIREVKKDLPKLRRAVDRLENESRPQKPSHTSTRRKKRPQI
jgi:hypothetical protein